MSYHWTVYACLFLALWSSLVGGVFKAFSEFIMSGLLRAAPASGINSMQQINKTVMRTEFVTALISIAVVSVAFALYAMLTFDVGSRLVIMLPALAYVPSVLLTTVLGNVPMNQRLDALDYKTAEAETYWSEYGQKWTRLNHIRTIGSIVTAGLYLNAAISLIPVNQP